MNPCMICSSFVLFIEPILLNYICCLYVYMSVRCKGTLYWNVESNSAPLYKCLGSFRCHKKKQVLQLVTVYICTPPAAVFTYTFPATEYTCIPPTTRGPEA